MKKTVVTIIMIALLGAITVNGELKKLDTRGAIVFGLNQPLVGGFNVEANFFYKRLAFDYSHGVSLDFSNEMLRGGYKNQGLKMHLPWTTGFGIGWRFTDWLNLRLEPKWHSFDIHYEGDKRLSSNRIKNYTTFTLGVGLYSDIRPFRKFENRFLQGIMIAPSVRYWPRVYSSLDDNKFSYLNRNSGKVEELKAAEVGIANTPLIVNISVGYSWKF